MTAPVLIKKLEKCIQSIDDIRNQGIDLSMLPEEVNQARNKLFIAIEFIENVENDRLKRKG